MISEQFRAARALLNWTQSRHRTLPMVPHNPATDSNPIPHVEERGPAGYLSLAGIKPGGVSNHKQDAPHRATWSYPPPNKVTKSHLVQ
jgi:hypothetical protein